MFVIEYRLADYASMLLDEGRVAAYRAAMQATIGPDDVVIDLGCGPGAMSMWALECGARHVYAVDANPSIAVLREAVRSHQLADRITVIDAWSTDVALPEQVDVIVSDLRGVLPLHRTHLASIIDVRDRLLKPGGHLIPTADSLYVAPVTHEHNNERFNQVWRREEHEPLASARRHVASEMVKADPAEPQLCAAPSLLGVIDYRTITHPHFEAETEWAIDQDGACHGAMVWFDADLHDGIGFSNGPEADPHIYGSMYFPLAEVLDLKAGDRLLFEVSAKATEKDDYRWRWRTRLERNDAPPISLDQSTFSALGRGPSLDRLRRSALDHRPRSNQDMQLLRSFLDGVDAQETIAEISQRAHRDVGERSGLTERQTLDRIRDLSIRFGR